MAATSEVFDAARHAPAIVGLLFGQRVRTRAWDGCSAGSTGNATIKESETRRGGYQSGGYEPWPVGILSEACFFLSARESAKGERGPRRGERTCVAIDGRTGGGLRWFIYDTPV